MAFASKKLSPQQQKWDTATCEAFAVVWACEFFRHHLVGREFMLYTDHAALQLLNDPKASMKILRWALRLLEFYYVVKHRKGTANANADSLSRMSNVPSDEMPVDFDIPTYDGPTVDEGEQVDMAVMEIDEGYQAGFASFDEPAYRAKMIADQRADPNFMLVIELLEGKVLTVEEHKMLKWKRARNLSTVMKLNDGLLIRALGDACQVVIPSSREEEFLHLFHENVTSGHMGITAMVQAMKHRVYFPGYMAKIKHKVMSCITCQSRKPPQPKRQGLLHPHKFAVTEPMADVAVDHYGPLPETPQGNCYILVIVDLLTRWAEAIPVPDVTAETTMQALWDHWVSRWSLMRRLYSDRGPAFANKVFEGVAKKVGMQHVFTHFGTPHENPYAERFNRAMGDNLTAYANKQGNNWDILLPALMFAYRARYHNGILGTPFYSLLGWDPRIPADVASGLVREMPKEESDTPVADRLGVIHASLREHLDEIAVMRKAKYDATHKDVTFVPESLVMVFREEGYEEGKSSKFISRYIGPFCVVKALGPVSYELRNIYTGEIIESHVNCIRQIMAKPLLNKDVVVPAPREEQVPDLMRDPGEGDKGEVVGPANVDVNGDAEYEIDAIVG